MSTPQSNARGVLGGAKTMIQHQRETRAERIARQALEWQDRKHAKEAAREAATRKEIPMMDTPSARPVAAPAPAPAPKAATQAAPARRFGSLPAMNTNRWTGVIIWLVGAYLTRSFLMQVGVSESYATPFGFVIQWILTRAESPLWRGQGAPKMAVIATVVDGAFNSGGAWPYMKHLGDTDVWTMISEASGTPGVPPTLLAIVICSIAVGLATAAAAEYFWNL